MHYSVDVDVDIDIDVDVDIDIDSIGRKRRRRLSMDGCSEEDNDNCKPNMNRDGGELFPFHQRRSTGENRCIRIQTKTTPTPIAKVRFVDASFDPATTRTKRKRRPISRRSNGQRVSLLWSFIVASASIYLMLMCGSIQQLQLHTANAFQPPMTTTTRQQQQQQQQHVFPRFMSLATPPSSTSSSTSSNAEASIPNKSELQSMKVVDLKQLIKDSGLNQRGLLSKLKKKQDMVEFLVENGTSNTIATTPDDDAVQPTTRNNSNINSNIEDSIRPRRVVIEQQTTATTTTTTTQPAAPERTPPKTSQQKPPPRKVPLTMPKRRPSTATTADGPSAASDNNRRQDEYRQPKQSSMNELFEKVNEQYPTLQYLQPGNSTLCGELDIRQRYHPMLQAGTLQAIPESEHETEREEDTTTTATTTTTNISSSNNSEEEPDKKDFKPALSGDMDIIFVGTASCTPSITRGVSCTALRLHSLASSSSASHKKKQAITFKKGNSGSSRNQPPPYVAENSQSKNLGTWLFDCGESTQLQIQKTSSVRPSKITKIFLTHAHGDHSFGLPGLLCLMGQDTAGGNEAGGERGPNGENIRKTKDSKPPIDIYGPEGLRLWLRTAIRYSVSRIVPRYRVHELKDVAMAPEWGYSPKWEKYYFNKAAYYETRNGNVNGNANANNNNNNNVSSNNRNPRNTEFYWGAANDMRKQSINDPRRRPGQSSDWLNLCDQGIPVIEPSEFYGEVEGGRDIYPIHDHPLSNDGAPIWEVAHEGGGDDDECEIDDPATCEPSSGVKVYAAPMSHGVPCVGYVIQEANRPGRLRDELVKPICMRNIPALKEAGFRHPMKALAVIKDLPEGGSFTFPDGTVVTQEEAVEPTRPGRKVVICGDTNSARSLDKLAKNADVIVHESTNAFLPTYDHRVSNFHSVKREAIFHGHSTPQIAGDFAKRTGAKRLIMNHFSARYMGDQSLESMSIMTRIEEQAMQASGLTRSDVAAAWDFMIFPIPKAVKKGSVDGDGETK